MSSLMRVLFRRGMSSTSSKIPLDKTTSTSATVQTKEEIAKLSEDTKTRIRKSTNDFYRDPVSHDIYLNPNISPPPRTPETPEDFRHPQKLGHWISYGYDWTSPIADKYRMHESFAIFFLSLSWAWFIWYYSPDYKLRAWAQREAFIRMHRREALGLPMINKDFVDPERVVLPPEEELVDFPVII